VRASKLRPNDAADDAYHMRIVMRMLWRAMQRRVNAFCSVEDA
jgi:hypothetical protein